MKQYIETPRLILRDWKEEDIPHFLQMNRNSEVMRYFLKKELTDEESLDMLHRMKDELDQYGYGVYAVERKEDHHFIGFIGFHHYQLDIDDSPEIEILWRLIPEVWGQGYATEAASACLKYAKEVLKLENIYAFTSLPNKASEKVMQKIGMKWVKEFNHPQVPPEHPLYRHVLYQTV